MCMERMPLESRVIGLFMCMFLVCILVLLKTSHVRMEHMLAHQSPRLLVATVVSDTNHPNFKLLEASAARHGHSFHVLKSDSKFGWEDSSGSFGSKLTLMHKFVSQASVHPNDLVMFVDGYDVIINAPSHEIITAYEQAVGGQDLALFSAEQSCWPDPTRAPEYDAKRHVHGGSTPYKYLNSGTYMGPAAVLKFMFDANIDKVKYTADDQRFFTDIYLSGGPIVLDHHARVFWCLYNASHHLRHTERGWMNSATNTMPLVFHGNGKDKDILYKTILPRL